MNDHDLVLAYRISGEEDFCDCECRQSKRKLSFDSKVHAALRKGKVLADRRTSQSRRYR